MDRPKNCPFGNGVPSPTLARIILEAVPDGVELVYGDPIVQVTEHDAGVTVTSSSGKTLEADLLVVAEGARSRTRGLVFRPEEVHPRNLDVTRVVGTIPRTAEDDSTWRWYNAIGGRSVHLRPDNHGTTRAILAYSPGEDLLHLDRQVALAQVRARYADVGWQAPRVLDAFERSEDLYVDQLTQIRVDSWSRGRVVLVGDAAWCVTQMGGGGASLALIGGYLIAAQLDKGAPERISAALAAYEAWMRPLVGRVQRTPRALVHFAYPRTRAGLILRSFADRLVTQSLLRVLVQRLHKTMYDGHPLPDWTTTPIAGG